jgi:DNA-binding response OmpR family regulator
MPGSMDGLKLARAIRERWPPIELILTSGHVDVTDSDVPERGLFFSKPYRDKEISSALQNLLLNTRTTRVGCVLLARCRRTRWDAATSASDPKHGHRRDFVSRSRRLTRSAKALLARPSSRIDPGRIMVLRVRYLSAPAPHKCHPGIC